MTDSGPRPRPRIVLTVLVRDEMDIVADMLHWHLDQGVDHVVAMDNGSTDGTAEFLEDLAASGALTLIHQPSDAYLQDVWTMQMARIARKRHAADWVIPTDADEFWMPPEGQDLPAALAAFGREIDMVRCPRRNLMAAREELETTPWHEALIWRAARPAALTAARRMDPAPLDPPLVYHALPSKVIVNPARLGAIDRGAHNARFDGPPRESTGSAITIHHAPFRDREEFLVSTARIADAVSRDPRAGPGTSWKSRRWRRMPPEEAFAEALPDAARLRRDIASGLVRMDMRLRDAVAASRARTGPALALYGAMRGVARGRPGMPILILGEAAGEVAAVAARLRQAGAGDPPRPGSATNRDEPVREAGLASELRAQAMRHGEALHVASIGSPGPDRGNERRDDASESAPASAIILLARGGRCDRSPADASPAMAEAEAATRHLPRLIAPAGRLIAASPEALRRTMAALTS